MKALDILLVAAIGLMLSCGQANKNDNHSKSEINEEKYAALMVKGGETSRKSFTALSIEVKSALELGGVPKAITYCNLEALPLTDSLSRQYDAIIKRTTLKIRNPENAPTDTEKEILMAYHEQLKNGEELSPHVVKVSEKEYLYANPIMINSFCLTCHGTPGQEIAEAHYQIIRKNYPQDKAVGYEEGDLRGMWSIRFTDEP